MLPSGKLGALKLLLRLCSDQNDTRIYAPMYLWLLQLVKPLEAIETKLPKKNGLTGASFFKLLSWCGLAKTLHLASFFLKVAIIHKHTALQHWILCTLAPPTFYELILCVRIMWRSSSPLVTTLDYVPRRVRHTSASRATMNARGEYAHVD